MASSVRRTSVRRTEDPAQVLSDAARFLAIDPIHHNVVLTLLHQRVADPEPGRYWIVDIGDEPAGVVFQSPLSFMATITPMPAGLSEPVSGVVRVGPVYTPTERRNSGYASALVAGVSSGVRSRGQRCMLYTDLANPTSNSVYQALGYRAVAEALRYAFDN